MSRLITSSRLKDARACDRLHELKFFRGYRSAGEEAAALRFGSLIHKGLEAWWRAKMAGLSDDECLVAMLAAVAVGDVWDVVKATELLRGYHCRWKDEAFEVLAVEVEFRAPLVNPETGASSRTWELAGKLDVVVRLHGRALLMEHKTSSEDIRPGSEYWRRLRMDGQISIYYTGARACGFDVEGCIYDVIGKPGIRPLKATPEASRKYTAKGALYANQRESDETPDEYRARLIQNITDDPAGYYARGEVVRLEAEMQDAMHDVWQTAQQIREGERLGRFPRNPDACSRFGRTCDFFDACSGEASLDDTSLFVKVTNVHPELNGSKEESTNGNTTAAAE